MYVQVCTCRPSNDLNLDALARGRCGTCCAIQAESKRYVKPADDMIDVCETARLADVWGPIASPAFYHPS